MTMQPSLAPRSAPLGLAAARPRIRAIDETDLDWALAEGWKDFKEKRGDVILLALLYPLIGFIAGAASFNNWLTPMFFPMVAGVSILGPAVATGFYEIARRREAGLDSSWWHLFDPLRGRSRLGLAELTAGLVALFLVWMVAASLIYSATLGATHPAGVADFLSRLFTTPEGWTMILVGNLVGFVFAVATLVFSFVSFAMVVDKPVDGPTAVAVSLRAVAANPRMTAVWGLKIAGLLLLGSLPAFIGLAVVLPVLGYATWHLYTCVVER
jgi:uncharacterized membrane protein